MSTRPNPEGETGSGDGHHGSADERTLSVTWKYRG